MTQININGMSNKVAAANINNNGISANNISNNNTNTAGAENSQGLMGLIVAGHDGAKDFGSGENGMDFNFAWGEYRIFVVRSYGVWKMRIYKNWRSAGNFDANLTPNWGGYSFGQRRWSKALVNDMVAAIENIIDAYMWGEYVADSEQEQEQMQGIVAEYQQEFDGYMEDLKMMVDWYDDIDYAYTAYVAKEIIRKMMQVSMDCLTALGEVTGCSMVWGDGWHIDADELGRWYRGYPLMDDDDMADLFDTLDSVMLDMPLGLDDEQIEWISTDGCGLGAIPTYLLGDVAAFAKTWVEFGPCTMPY